MADDHDPVLGARRISVYGVTGSGKTTTAARIAAATGLPWYSVDDLTWNPGWVPVPADEQRRRVAAISEREAWILDTMYGAWLDVPWQRVELIIGLDFSRWLTFARLLRRTAARVIDRRTVCNGNVETVRNSLAKDSILVWHFRSFKSKRARMRAWERSTSGPRMLRFTRPRDLERWLASLERVVPAG